MNVDQMRAINAILRYDETSTGAELVYYFVNELGVSEAEAWRCVHGRQRVAQEANGIRAEERDRAVGAARGL